MTSFRKMRWEQRPDRVVVCHLPFGDSTLELSEGRAPPGATGPAPNREVTWCRLRLTDGQHPYDGWFALPMVRGRGRTWVDRVENCAGFVGAMHQLMAAYWEAYARALEERLRTATRVISRDDTPFMPEPMRVPEDDGEDW